MPVERAVNVQLSRGIEQYIVVWDGSLTLKRPMFVSILRKYKATMVCHFSGSASFFGASAEVPLSYFCPTLF